MKLNKKDTNKIFGSNVAYYELPLLYQLATKKDMDDSPIIKTAKCSIYYTDKMPVFGFYKPIMKCITKR